MIGRIVPVLVACCVTACAGQHTQQIPPTPIKAAGCDAFGNVWKLDVTFGLDGTPVGVVPGQGNPGEIKDPERLKVQECDNVLFTVRNGNENRSAIVFFDKDDSFRSPGKRLAYLTRNGVILIPIDDREVMEDEEFEYSIHVDCPERIRCAPIDPKIVVER